MAPMRADADWHASSGAVLLHFTFGIVSVALALPLPYHLLSVAGRMYFLIGPALGLYWR